MFTVILKDDGWACPDCGMVCNWVDGDEHGFYCPSCGREVKVSATPA